MPAWRPPNPAPPPPQACRNSRATSGLPSSTTTGTDRRSARGAGQAGVAGPEGPFLSASPPPSPGSDRRAFFGLAGRGSAFGRILKVSAEALAEKKMWQTYGDSLDCFSALAVVEAGPVPWERPCRSACRARRGGGIPLRSPGPALATQPGGRPRLGSRLRRLRKSVMAAWEARIFSFPSSRLGFLRQGPYLLANWYGDHFTAELEAQVMDDRYRRDTAMFASRAWEGRRPPFAPAPPAQGRRARPAQRGIRPLRGHLADALRPCAGGHVLFYRWIPSRPPTTSRAR